MFDCVVTVLYTLCVLYIHSDASSDVHRSSIGDDDGGGERVRTRVCIEKAYISHRIKQLLVWRMTFSIQ